MDSRTIRDRFLAFFDEKTHTRVPSSSLVPDDPTLLLTNAGMNQFKPYFLGEQQPPFPRATSVQKCFRATDIDEVGKTARHLTFFEMLGNFSFGDYYKESACPWAWQFVTDDLGIDPDRLWVTVYETDDEAFQIWVDAVGVRPERVVRWGKDTNFWSMGVAGPCGPCSEIYVDLGPDYGEASDRGPAGNEDRYLEIWNLVFMQNDCDAAIEPIAELPTKNIDTGAGVERLAMVLQNVPTIYETDTLGGMVRRAEELTKTKYGSDDRADKGLRILGDHGRSMTFLIADGVLPSNEERGYVLRRVMRRAVREARLLGREEPILGALVDETIELMGDFYPEISERRELIHQVVEREEEHFSTTLRQGLVLLENEIDTARAAGSGVPGDVAFRLHDTFGFPFDLTRDIASEAGLKVDEEAFRSLMEQQRTRARAARKRAGSAGRQTDKSVTPQEVATEAEAVKASHGSTEFVGYEHASSHAKVLAILDGTDALVSAGEGSEVELVLDVTPFYAEGGGQVGDRGSIIAPSGRARVVDTRRLVPGLTGHRTTVDAGEIRVGDPVDAIIDTGFRSRSEMAHTATHILHWALRDKLGDHARQAGSLVEPGRLRFDFSHFDALSEDTLDELTTSIRDRVGCDDGVRAYETSFDFARSIGAMAIFGERYGDFVRVVEVGDYSKELCGGTHVAHTSRIGPVVITSEGSVGSNLRRVEALVGADGLRWLEDRVAVLDRAAGLLKANPEEVAERIERLLATHKELERQVASVSKASTESDAARLASEAAAEGDGHLVVARRDEPVDALRSLAQAVKGRLGRAIVVLGSSIDGKANLVAAVSKDLVAEGITARELLAPGATVLGGGAGGKPDLAVAGGAEGAKIDEALNAVASAARGSLTKTGRLGERSDL